MARALIELHKQELALPSSTPLPASSTERRASTLKSPRKGSNIGQALTLSTTTLSPFDEAVTHFEAAVEVSKEVFSVLSQSH
jgi:hypothetical protein